jgi:hypothetical protein
VVIANDARRRVGFDSWRSIVVVGSIVVGSSVALDHNVLITKGQQPQRFKHIQGSPSHC